MTFRILVTGSRDWDRPDVIGEALIELVNWYPIDWDDTIIVHGDCPTGADHAAELFGRRYGIATERHPADWKKYGRAAGPYRNQKMVDLGADIVLAFKNPGSRGTQDCINRALKAGLEVKIYEGEVK